MQRIDYKNGYFNEFLILDIIYIVRFQYILNYVQVIDNQSFRES